METTPGTGDSASDDAGAAPVLERFRLTDRVAVVTGSGKGIGAAIAIALAEAGADVALVARTGADLERVADEIRRRGRRPLVFPADINDLDTLPRLLDAIDEAFGGLDIVVNNAGGSQSYPFLDTRVEHLAQSFHFNILAAFELSRLAVPRLLARGGGSIINISSVAGSKTTRGGLVHGTMKAAMSHMTRMMAADLAPRIRVNAVLPGAIETAALERLLTRMDPGVRATMIERTPMRRNGRPDDISPAVVYLASPAASWVTGKLIEIDGNASADLIPKSIPDL
jgi:7-alpha-hydroxysteroid dehydrogenase